MTDLTPVFNELLKKHDAQPTVNPDLTIQNIDEFLKEAYRIVSLSCNLEARRYFANTWIECTHCFTQLLPSWYPPIIPLDSSSSKKNKCER